MKVKIKICGINTVESAISSKNADFVGFVFYPKSPRFVTANEAKEISSVLTKQTKKVGLFVNPDKKVMDYITEFVDLDIIQLHGKESVQEIKEIKQRLNLPIIKAIPVSENKDIENSKDFHEICDMILFDAKMKSGELPGGSGKTFDWKLLKSFSFKKNWILAGGLNIENVKGAISLTNAPIIDVSSGVESEKGIKCAQKIKDFIKYVRKN